MESINAGPTKTASDACPERRLPSALDLAASRTNILSACVACNAHKQDGDHLRPLTLPRRPTTAELLRAGLEFLPSDLREDFGSWLYWDTELEP
ncbi:MAG TPA: hypothetical protein VMA53_18775 [Stellaceae bacterium]|nr:hypothetical protein [Stellaceae bacterium]